MASERIINEYDSTRIANAVDTLASNLADYSGTTVTPTDAMKAKLPSQTTADRIADALTDIADVAVNGTAYGTSNSSKSTVAKSVTTAKGNFNLVRGSKVLVKFAHGSDSSNLTLNVDSTGAKPVYMNGAALEEELEENGTYQFVYNGTQFDLVGGAGGGGGPQTAIIALSATTASVDNATSTATITMTTNSDGTPSVSSSDTDVATASISNNTITITGVGSGNATVTVSIPATSSYTAATATITVTSTVFIPVIGGTYKLGSGAHTAGSVDLECVVLDIIGTNAVCQSKGIYGAAWPGISELTSVKSTYFGLLSEAVSGVYLPRGNADGSAMATAPTKVYIYNGSSFVNTYNTSAKNTIIEAARQYAKFGVTVGQVAPFGTPKDASVCWGLVNGNISDMNNAIPVVIAPSFILDLTKVKLHGDRIIDKDAVVPKIVTWANGTDAEIVALVQAADNGDIDLYADAGWRVGDERVVTLSAMQASGTASNGVSYSVGETHVSQTVTLVLMNRGGKTLSGGGTCNFVFGLKNMLANNGTREGGYMNSTNTNVGGWNSCARRNWCNGAFYDAFPSTLRPILKQFINHTATGDSTAATDSTDWFALASEVEIFGATTYANATAETGNTQFEYYTTSANRIKKQGDAGSASLWWERSPRSGGSSTFCRVDSGGNAYYYNASDTYGLAPFGCL